MARPALAADSILLDVSPDDGTGATGDVVTLTADLFDGSGDPLLVDHDVRVYFVSGAQRSRRSRQQPRPDLHDRRPATAP